MFRILVILIGGISLLYSQMNSSESKLLPMSELEKKRWFYSLEEAMQNPDVVYKLSLQGQKLKEFPMEVFLFKNLQVLNLSDNNIKYIPKEIGQLKYLQVLNLQKNKIRKLPEEIGNLRNLHTLYLSRNRIVYFPVEFCSLKQLKYLDVSFNRLSVYEVSYLLKCLPNTEIIY